LRKKLINKESDSVSLAQLVKMFMPYINKKAKGFSIAGLDTDDLTQEGLIGLLNAFESFDAEHSAAFSTYAITCINNSILTAVKKAARKKHLPLNSYTPLDDKDGTTLIGGYTPEELAIADEGYAALRNRINDDLSGYEKEVLSLYLEGYDYLAVAKRLGTTPKSIDNALQRARNKLKPKR
jgi:RNA polymerase sigma factor, sigma-70 family